MQPDHDRLTQQTIDRHIAEARRLRAEMLGRAFASLGAGLVNLIHRLRRGAQMRRRPA